MNKKKILIIDDEEDICEILRFNLNAAGYETAVAHSAEEALKKGVSEFDLLLLDIMMEGISGFQMAGFLKSQKETTNIPIIFISAKDSEEDTVKGFGIGADDYIAKPFSIREVLSRVKAVLRRVYPDDDFHNIKKFDGLEIDMRKKEIKVDGEQVILTRTELEILNLLLGHPGMVYSREAILAKVWPNEVIVLGRTVDVNITRLRKKLGKYGSFIVTRHGYGYCFEGLSQ